MNFLSNISLSILAIIVLLVVVVLGWLYVDHLRSTIKILQTAQQQAVDASKHSSEALAKALDDFKRQSDILAKQKARAVAQAKALSDRYHQIMEAKDESVISPILCASLVRVYEVGGTNRGELSVPHSEGTAYPDSVAESACKDINQKDLAAWIETQVYPSFKAMQQQMVDLSSYTGN